MNREIGRSLARNISVLFSAQMINWVSSFVLLYFLPRYLGNEDYGRLYLALSIKMILGLLIDFGGNYLIPKEVARTESVGRQILNSYIVLRILLWILSIGIILLFSDLLGYSEHVELLILVLAIAKLWEGGTTAINAYFEGIERMAYPSLGSIVERMFVAAAAVIALLMGADSLVIAVIMSAGALLNLLVILYFSRSFVTLAFRFDFKLISLIGSGMPYFLFSLFSVIYYRIDAVMISAMTSEAVTGWYGGAYRFFDMVMVLPLIYQTAIFPVFSRLWENKTGVLNTAVGESIRLMILLGMPTAMAIFLFAEPIIDFFMGLEDYGPSVLILQIFAIGIPIIYIDIILGSALMGAANRQRAWAIVGFIAIFVNIAANYLLIPHTQAIYGNGGIGAAISTLVTELFVMGSAFLLLPRNYLSTFTFSYLFKPAIVSTVMILLLWSLLQWGVHWILTAAFGPALYIAGLLLIRTFSREELMALKSAFQSTWNQFGIRYAGKSEK